jgi:hypothetical protein
MGRPLKGENKRNVMSVQLDSGMRRVLDEIVRQKKNAGLDGCSVSEEIYQALGKYLDEMGEGRWREIGDKRA